MADKRNFYRLSKLQCVAMCDSRNRQTVSLKCGPMSWVNHRPRILGSLDVGGNFFQTFLKYFIIILFGSKIVSSEAKIHVLG